MPPSRCIVTTAGLSSQVTVHMPSRPWNTTRPSSSHGRTRGAPCPPRRVDSTAMAMISTPSVDAR